MKIYLDDIRETPEGWTLAKNLTELKEIIEQVKKRGEKIESISFDHDLGEGEIDGYGVMKWLSETYPEYLVGETTCEFHSANPVGRENMEKFLEFCQKNKVELLEKKIQN